MFRSIPLPSSFWTLAKKAAPVQSRSEIYMAKAKECDRAAKSTVDLDVRKGYRNLAKQWRKMAADAAHLDRQKQPNPLKNSN
jgi:hypothetical protein